MPVGGRKRTWPGHSVRMPWVGGSAPESLGGGRASRGGGVIGTSSLCWRKMGAGRGAGGRPLCCPPTASGSEHGAGDSGRPCPFAAGTPGTQGLIQGPKPHWAVCLCSMHSRALWVGVAPGPIKLTPASGACLPATPCVPEQWLAVWQGPGDTGIHCTPSAPGGAPRPAALEPRGSLHASCPPSPLPRKARGWGFGSALHCPRRPGTGGSGPKDRVERV